MMRQLDGVRQRLGPLQPSTSTLTTRKINLEADLDRLTYLANDMWRALQAPDFAAARRIKSRVLQLQKTRDEEAQKPLAEQRREVYGRGARRLWCATRGDHPVRGSG